MDMDSSSKMMWANLFWVCYLWIRASFSYFHWSCQKELAISNRELVSSGVAFFWKYRTHITTIESSDSVRRCFRPFPSLSFKICYSVASSIGALCIIAAERAVIARHQSIIDQNRGIIFSRSFASLYFRSRNKCLLLLSSKAFDFCKPHGQ